MEANRLLHRRENGTIWIANFCYSHLFPLIFSRVTCNLDYLSIYSCNAFLLVIAPWKPVNKILSSLLYSWSNQIVEKKKGKLWPDFIIECSFVTIYHPFLLISVYLNTEQIWQFPIMLLPLNWNLWSGTSFSIYYKPGISTNKSFKKHYILSTKWKIWRQGLYQFYQYNKPFTMFSNSKHLAPRKSKVFSCLK